MLLVDLAARKSYFDIQAILDFSSLVSLVDSALHLDGTRVWASEGELGFGTLASAEP